MNSRSALLFFSFLTATTFTACKKKITEPPATVSSFLKVSGTKIVDGNNQPVRLQGVAFGNDIWSNNSLPSYTHHSETDYSRLKVMGMNVVRFYLNYKILEDDATPYQYKQTGWNWIEQNILWAKKHGIYLILNMHAPQGGYQSQGNGDALWNDIENQNRLTALWKAIANKYKDETQIIGYGPVNEPVPSTNISQWQQLAQRIINEIRTADKNHILFIEKAIWVKGQAETTDYNFPAVTDNNMAYEFHFYDPHPYTHQLFSWAGTGDGGKYPDESVVSYTSSQWYTAIFNNPSIASGTNNWQYFEGVKYTVNDANIKLAVPTLVAAGVAGRVYFDNIEIKEYDASGNFVQSILQMNLNTKSGWSFWSKNGSGAGGVSTTTGNGDNESIFIEGATDDCNYSNYSRVFRIRQGYQYQINGWMKGENVATTANCKLRIDFLKTDDPVFGRNKQYLEFLIKRYTDWATAMGKPLYMGEFGAGYHCFQNNKGGLQWVTDMIDIASANNIYFTYHAYHEDSFGLYYGYGNLPDPAQANQPLIDLFTQKLK